MINCHEISIDNKDNNRFGQLVECKRLKCLKLKAGLIPQNTSLSHIVLLLCRNYQIKYDLLPSVML